MVDLLAGATYAASMLRQQQTGIGVLNSLNMPYKTGNEFRQALLQLSKNDENIRQLLIEAGQNSQLLDPNTTLWQAIVNMRNNERPTPAAVAP